MEQTKTKQTTHEYMCSRREYLDNLREIQRGIQESLLNDATTKGYKHRPIAQGMQIDYDKCHFSADGSQLVIHYMTGAERKFPGDDSKSFSLSEQTMEDHRQRILDFISIEIQNASQPMNDDDTIVNDFFIDLTDKPEYHSPDDGRAFYTRAYCLNICPPNAFNIPHPHELKIATSYIVAKGLTDGKLNIFYSHKYRFKFLRDKNGLRELIYAYNERVMVQHDFKDKISIILRNLNTIGTDCIDCRMYHIMEIDQLPEIWNSTTGKNTGERGFPPDESLMITKVKVTLESGGITTTSQLHNDSINDEDKKHMLGLDTKK